MFLSKKYKTKNSPSIILQNFSKDIIQKYEFIKNKLEYNKFKKEIKNLDKKTIITSEFAKRLKLKNIR